MFLDRYRDNMFQVTRGQENALTMELALLRPRTKLMAYSVIFELASIEDELTVVNFDLYVPLTVARNEPKGLVRVFGSIWMSTREMLGVSRLLS